MCQAKRKYEIYIADNYKNNPNYFFNSINDRQEIKSGIGPLNESDGKVITEDLSVANLNNYFPSVLNIAIPNSSTANTNDEDIINVNLVHTLQHFEITTN